MGTSVQEILNGVQNAAAACDRCASSLWKLALASPDVTYEDLQVCVDYLLTISQKSPHVERCIRFFQAFASKAPADNEVAAAFVEELLQHLASHLSAIDKVVRYRSCQLLQQILLGLPEHILLEESVADSLRVQLAERLQDKLVVVRAEAVRCISHLIDDSEEGQMVLQGLIEMLDTEKSKDVRIAVLQSLPLYDTTMPVMLQHTRDENPVVRKAVIQRLKGVSIKLLSIKQRAEVIQHTLLDQDTAVAEAAADMLAQWLQQDCAGDPLKLLQLLDVETYTDAAVLAVESLIKTDSISSISAHGLVGRTSASKGVVSYVEAATSRKHGSSEGDLVGLCQLAEGQSLQPHEALMWRCLCEWLRSDAISKGLAAAATAGARAAVQAAVAAERHEVLERALPESADQLLQLVSRHASAGPAARFAATQLLMIAATCVEWTDAASRSMAMPYIQELINLEPTAEVEHADAALSDASDDDDALAEAAGMQLAGNGGEGLFEAAVVQLVLAVQGAGTGFTVAMQDGIAPLAAEAGLLGKPDALEGAEEACVTVCIGDSSQVLQCLAYIQLLLQQLPCGRRVEDEGSTMSFVKLWELLLLLALKQDQPVIRAKAVECIALYALAGASNPGILSSAVQIIGPLAVAGGCSATKQAAVQGLTDIALLFGPAAVDAVLRSPSLAAAGSADADDEQLDGVKEPLLHKGLLELLIEQGEVLLAEAQAPAAKAKKGARAVVKSEEPSGLSASSAELLFAVAESLAKLLLHQRTWLKRYAHWERPAARSAAAAGDGLLTPGCPAAAAGAIPFPPDSRQHQALLLVKAVSLLLQLQHHPATESAVQLRQCLGVFFGVFAAAARDNRLQLVAACLPAARQALHVNSKQNPAVLLDKSVVELMQDSHLRDQQQHQPATGCLVLMVDGQPATFEALAMQLLHEACDMAKVTLARGLQPTKYKPYVSSLLKLVCELPLQPTGEDLEGLQALCDRLSDSITDATVKKDVTSVKQLLQQLAKESGQDQQQLDPEQLDQLIANLEALSLQLPPLPEAVAAAGSSSAAATPAPRTARRTAAGRTGSRGAATAGRTAARGTAVKRRAVASSSSSEDGSDSSSESQSEDDRSSDSSSDGEGEPATAVEELATATAGLAMAGDKAADKTAASEKPSRRSSARQPLGPSSLVNA